MKKLRIESLEGVKQDLEAKCESQEETIAWLREEDALKDAKIQILEQWIRSHRETIPNQDNDLETPTQSGEDTKESRYSVDDGMMRGGAAKDTVGSSISFFERMRVVPRKIKIPRRDKVDDGVLKPKVINYSPVIDACTAEKAKALLHEMYIDFVNGDESAKANIRSFAIVFQRAELLKHFESGELDTMPNVVSYTTVINCWAKARKQGGTERAESILCAMLKHFDSGEPNTKLDVVSYNSVINCWAKSRQQEGAERAKSILREMQDRHKAGDEVLKPNVTSYNLVINAYVTRGKAEKAEALLNEMCIAFVHDKESVKPNVRSFNTVLDAWSKSASREAPQRAEEILSIMIKHFKSGELDTKPNYVCFTNVIKCWAKSRQKGAAERAEALLDEMYIAFVNGNESVKPDVRSFFTVLDAWSKSASREAPQRAEQMMSRMRQHFDSGELDTKPNAVSYALLISCWAKSGQSGAADRAEAIVHEMQDRYKAGDDLKPNVIIYSSVIFAWSRSRQRESVSKAESLLNEMLILAEAGDKNCAPNAMCYNHVLYAITTSGLPDDLQRVGKLVKKMKDNGISSDQFMRKALEKFSRIKALQNAVKKPHVQAAPIEI